MAGFTPAGGTDTMDRVETHDQVTPDKGWNVILFNDPVNTLGMATRVAALVLELTEEEAESLVLTVHTEGRGMVFHGAKEEAETKVAAFLGFKFWATLERAA